MIDRYRRQEDAESQHDLYATRDHPRFAAGTLTPLDPVALPLEHSLYSFICCPRLPADEVVVVVEFRHQRRELKTKRAKQIL